MPLTEQVLEALEVLPDTERYIIHKHFWEEESVEEIAVDLGITPVKVRNLLLTGMDRIKAEVMN